MKVSVIIPVYNVKPYLERCIHSVLQQTYKDLEIIMVDDGSTDGSGELAESLKDLSPCIQVVHQENQGLSGARNTGIHHATGEYLVFLDSDDEWLLSDGLDTLMENADADLIVFKHVHIWGQERRENTADYDVETICMLPDAQAVFSHLILTQQFRMSACMLLVRREIIIQHQILFPLGYISEDVIWSLHLWQYVHTVSIRNLNFYGYYHRGASISTTPTFKVYDSYDKIFTYWKEQCDNGCVNSEAICVYLADLWTNMGYLYHELPQSDKGFALQVLERHKGLLNNARSSKSKRSQSLVKILGVKYTGVVLGWYWRLRTLIKKNAV